jgi:O-antigen/teichoic acid export membrane protein
MFESRSAKVLVLSSGQALTSLVGVVSMAVLTRVFSKADYATYGQTMLAYTFAVPFVTLGLDRALYFFLPGEKDKPRTWLVENLLLLALAGGALSLFLLLGGNHLLARRLHNPDLASVVILLAPYPLFMLPASAMSACLMARNRTEQVAGFNVCSRVMMLIFVLLPVLFWQTPSAAIGGTVAGAMLMSSVAIVLMFRACPTGAWRPTWAGMKAQLWFAVPLGLATLAGTVSQTLDQALIAARCSREVFATYRVGLQEVPLVEMVTGAITAVVMVDYARYYRDNHIAGIVRLIHSAMMKSAMILLPAMVFLLCIAPDLMAFLFGAQYRESSLPFRVYLLLLPVRTITFGAVLQATGKSHHILVSAVLMLAVNAVLGWFAIGWIGPIGAVLASVAATYLACVPYMIGAIRATLGVSFRELFPWLALARLLATTIVPGIATLAVAVFLPGPPIVRLAAATVVYGGLLAAIMVWAGLIRIQEIIEMARAQVKARLSKAS